MPTRPRHCHHGAEEVPGRWAGPCWTGTSSCQLTGLPGRTQRRGHRPQRSVGCVTRAGMSTHTAHTAHVLTCTCLHTRVPAHGCPPPLLPRLWPRGLPNDVTGPKLRPPGATHALRPLENLTPVYLSGKFWRLLETLTLGHFPVVLLQLNAQGEGRAVGHVHHLRPQNHHPRGLCWERAGGCSVGGRWRRPRPLTGVGRRALGAPAAGGLCVAGHERA